MGLSFNSIVTASGCKAPMNDFEGMPTIGRSPSGRAEGVFVEIVTGDAIQDQFFISLVINGVSSA